MARINAVADWLLRAPMLWGSLLSLAFYAALRTGWVDWPYVDRYFDAHLVERVSTHLFFVGLAALGIRLAGMVGQFSAIKSDLLGATPAGGQPTSDAACLLRRLEEAPQRLRHSLVAQRLREGLQYVRDTGSADSLEEHLRRLEDTAVERMSAGYGLPSLIRATLPIVGMLGTVIGITQAIGQLSPDQLELSLTSVMAALSIAFDTTAQAMSLMLVLWFAMFFVQRVEERLLAGVDRATSRELVGRFQQYGASTDPNVASIRRMGEQVVVAVEQLAAKQAQAWESTIDATHERWSATTTATGEVITAAMRDAVGEQLRDQSERLAENSKAFSHDIRDGLATMAQLLVESLRDHGKSLTTAEQRLATENRRHLTEVEAALGESMVVAADRQEKLIHQSERLLNDVREALTAAAETHDEKHRDKLRQSERLVEQMQASLASTTEAASGHQDQLIKQSDILLRIVESTGEVQRLEKSLNRNLATLGRGQDFENTLVSLTAAVRRLTTRLGRDGEAPQTGKAA